MSNAKRMSAALLFLASLQAVAAFAQTAPPTDPAVMASIHRLVLSDGSYQAVRRYQIKGDRVRYISAERGGEWEELPVSMIDWAATLKYAREHTEQGRAEEGASADARAIDAEEAEQKAEQNSRTPAVMPRLHLPDRDGVWALDYFQNQPELAVLEQNSGDVNQQTGHNILRAAVNPFASRKQEVRLDGDHAKVHLHEAQPAFFVSLSGGDDSAGPGALGVDTHGAKPATVTSSSSSQYVIVAVEPRRNYRVVTSVTLSALGHASQSQDVMPTTTTVLPGAHWMKVTPKQPLSIGEYALMEVLSAKEINLSVWDFSIDPAAGDNKNAILPLDR